MEWITFKHSMMLLAYLVTFNILILCERSWMKSQKCYWIVFVNAKCEDCLISLGTHFWYSGTRQGHHKMSVEHATVFAAHVEGPTQPIVWIVATGSSTLMTHQARWVTICLLNIVNSLINCWEACKNAIQRVLRFC